MKTSKFIFKILMMLLTMLFIVVMLCGYTGIAFAKDWLEMTFDERRNMIRSIYPNEPIDEDALKNSDSQGEYRERARIYQEKKAKREREIQISKQPKSIQALIRAGKIQIGMTKEQVILSWGKPNHIHRTVGRWGVHEQWVYGDTYLYFENDILDSFQD